MNNSIKILYVEDDALFRELFKTILKGKSKYSLDVATNGKEGAELNSKNNYDIIFMDIMMPEMSGIEAAYIIKMTSPTTPIVAITAMNKEEVGEVGKKDFPIDYYLRKPIHSNVLIKKIDELVSN